MHINVRTSEEIEIMRQGGLISKAALDAVLEKVKPGVTLLELDAVAEQTIKRLGATASFKTVDDYPFATCINVNEGIVHGLPSERVIEVGDILSIDLGALYRGFHTDLSYTLEVGTDKETKFLAVGKKALELAITACVLGNTIGDIGSEIQNTIERAGYSVSRELVGHGVGKELHEDPYVPGYGRKGKGLPLKEGMVLAIEVIYQRGRPALALEADDWTIRTADKSLSALFEDTVAITKAGPLVLTR